MEVIRISELPEKSSAEVADIVPIVDVSGSSYVTKRTTIAGLVAQAISAWWNGSSAKAELDGVVESVSAIQETMDGVVESVSAMQETMDDIAESVSAMQETMDRKMDVNSAIDGGQY